MSAADYARATGDLLRPSTPIDRWPHVELLRAYVHEGPKVLDPEPWAGCSYLANARRCIDVTGHYFGATTPEGVREVAAEFLDRFDDRVDLLGRDRGRVRPGRSGAGEPVRVRPIRHSSCFEVVDGHHRLAAAYVAGRTRAEVVVEWRRVWTPLQSLLRQMSWLDGRLHLYQPLDFPELGPDWVRVRRCTDRLERMRDFLESRSLLGGDLSYLDVASCYGWFLGEMAGLGFDVHGIEQDPLGAVLADQVFGVTRERVEIGDCIPILESTRTVHDVVSCFSLLHHFALGRGTASAERLIELLDLATGRVLFLDTGQAHETWFRDTLPEWDADFVEGWLKRHTSFDEVVRLGPDGDAVPPFEGNYGRTLFACVRRA